MPISDPIKRKEYMDAYNKKKASKKEFIPGQIVEVCGEWEGRMSRVGQKCRIVRKGWAGQYWVKFPNEPEMSFKRSWLREIK